MWLSVRKVSQPQEQQVPKPEARLLGTFVARAEREGRAMQAKPESRQGRVGDLARERAGVTSGAWPESGQGDMGV